MSQQINLYNPAFRRVRDLLAAPLVGAAALACLAVVAVLALWANHGARQREAELAALQPQVKQQQDELAALARELAVPKRNARLEAELAEATALLEGREEVLHALAGGGQSIGFADTLAALARQSLPGLWLTQFSVADGSGELTLRGRTLDPIELPVFIRRLNAEKALQGRPIAELSLKDATLAAPTAASTAAATPAAGRHFTEFLLSSGKGGPETATAGGRP